MILYKVMTFMHQQILLIPLTENRKLSLLVLNKRPRPILFY